MFAENARQNADFNSPCHYLTNKSIFIEPTNERVRLALVSKQHEFKSPGPDNFAVTQWRKLFHQLLILFYLSSTDAL